MLATQSLAKLDDLSRTMRDTILANVGCLAVFQVAGADARTSGVGAGQGAGDRGRHRVAARAPLLRPRHRGHGPDARLLDDGAESPSPETPPSADRIREASDAYTVPAPQIAYGDAEGDLKLEKFRRGVEDLDGRTTDGRKKERRRRSRTPTSGGLERRKRKSRRRQAADAGAHEREEARGMRPEGCEPDLLRALARMPFLNRLEMVAVTGWSRGAVYEAVERMEDAGLCASVLHATGLLAPGAQVPPHRRRG